MLIDLRELPVNFGIFPPINLVYNIFKNGENLHSPA